MQDIARKRWISLLAVIAVAVMIFFFSAQEGEDSANLSGDVTEGVLSMVVPGFRDFTEARKAEYLDRFGIVVRKCAHFLEFALLAVTLSIHLHYVMLKSRFRLIAMAAWGFATLYAATDELHQIFVNERGPSLGDVSIDSAGALAGAFAGIGLIILWHKHKRRSRLA